MMASHNASDNSDDTDEADDPQLTEIVAYLDGELDDLQSVRLERKLASDPPLRGYADSLDRTWQLLDNLGEAAASGEFTQKTLASLGTVSGNDENASGSAGDGKSRLLRTVPVARIMAWTLAGFLGCSAGLLIARATQGQKKESQDVQILRQLDLLESYPRIYHVPDIEFLRKLSNLEGTSDEKGKAE
jgi:anti-sigma factor RsiW